MLDEQALVPGLPGSSYTLQGGLAGVPGCGRDIRGKALERGVLPPP